MRSEEFPRALTPRESEVLESLLSFDFKGSEQLREQARKVSVVDGCECGCASVSLQVDRDESARSSTHSPVPAEGMWHREDGSLRGGIILLLEDGWLSYLEIYGNAYDPPPEFPDPAQVEFFLNE